MTLYKLNTVGLGDFFIIAPDLNSAGDKLIDMLNTSDYGFCKDRKIESIDIIAYEIDEFPIGKPNFSSGNKLIIIK